MPSIRIVIDTDPGIDDVVALALAAVSPEIEIIGVTTSYGNVPLDIATSNAHRILDLVGRSDISIRSGADRPMTRELVTAQDTHGYSGIGYASAGDKIHAKPCSDALVSLLANLKEPVTLVTLGPLTNLAHAIEMDIALVRRTVFRHIGMFGNLRERGNTNRWADFNAWCDPEATQTVLSTEFPTEMVGLDVTRKMVVTDRETRWLQSQSGELLSWFGEALRFYVEFHHTQERLDGCVINDVLTIGELVRPGLLGFKRTKLEVALTDDEERGRTRETGNGFETLVATTVDIQMMRKLLDRVFSDSWRQPTEEQ